MGELVEISLSMRSIDAHTVEIKTGERLVTTYTIRLVEVDHGWAIHVESDDFSGEGWLGPTSGSAWPTADIALTVAIGWCVRTIRYEIIRADEKSDAEAQYRADEAGDRAEIERSERLMAAQQRGANQ